MLPADLAARLETAEAILDALGRHEADAIMGGGGLMFVRPKDVFERERQARQALEDMVAQRTEELRQVNARLIEDIAKRQRVEQALVRSEERARELAELSSDWFWEQDEHFRFTSFSPGAIEKSGALSSLSLLIGRTRWDLEGGLDEPAWRAHRALVEAHEPFKNFEYGIGAAACAPPPGCRPVEWVSISGRPLFDARGQFKGYRGTGRNITERKQAEHALRDSQSTLRKLACHLEHVREDERKRIARDIHDDLGQNLMVLRIDVSMMAACPGSAALAKERVDRALSQIDTSIRAVRTIINDLRPAALDLGLHAALEWQAAEFARRTGIACQLQIDHDEFALDDQGVTTALFRIVQEALINVLRHAKASHVRIDMQRTQDRLWLKIIDDGIGFAADSVKKENSFGLIGIEERIEALAGAFTILSTPGQGTALVLSIPLSIAQ